MYTITIIGGGFSGTLTAINLVLKLKSTPAVINIIDINSVGKGVAYSTTDDCHLLNVPVGNMSLFPDAPEHFYFWLKEKGLDIKKTDFLPRKLYAEYIQNVFETVVFENWKNIRVEIVKDEAIDIIHGQGRSAVLLKTGKKIISDKIILALGNFTPSDPAITNMDYTKSKRYIHNPWNNETFNMIGKDDDVMLIGTGLTTVDMLMSLNRKDHKGKIVAFSRHGYLPHTHHTGYPYPDFYNEIKNLDSVYELFKVVKKHMRLASQNGSSYEAVIDSIRPHIQQIWLKLDISEKKGFLRHFKAKWDVIRHRIPKESAEVINTMLANGQLWITGGALQEIRNYNDGLKVLFKERKTGIEKELNMSMIINCTGPSCDYEKSKMTLIKNMVKKGHLKNSALNIGINALPGGSVIDIEGNPSDILFTLGPPLKGILWETTAVPEIRKQAAALAATIAADLKEEKRNAG